MTGLRSNVQFRNLSKSLSTITEHFEVIVAEDGSSDGSTEFVRQYETISPHVKLLHSDIRQGRGKALNRAIRTTQGSIVCYYDVDLATDMQHLPDVIDAIRKGADISTGSRLLPESDIRRTEGREIASRTYNFLVGRSLGAGSSITSVDSRRLTRQKSSPSFPRFDLITGSGTPNSSSGHRDWIYRSQNFPSAGARVKEQPSG